ncbi:MAG TPA: hypothetical protein VHV10_06260 [Ktedonobacteraceae bacterium]|nr:hypothetical protein [Ktedonobacteraceae bacterium]
MIDRSPTILGPWTKKSQATGKERTSNRLPCAALCGTVQDSSRHIELIFPDFRSLVLDGTVLLPLFLLDILSNRLHYTVQYRTKHFKKPMGLNTDERSPLERDDCPTRGHRRYGKEDRA